MLEQVTEPNDDKSSKRKADDCDSEEIVKKRKRDCDDDKTKSKPIALVPPRMHNAAGTPSPLINQYGKRGRQKRKSKDHQTDTPSKFDQGQTSSHRNDPLAMSSPFHSDMTQQSPYHVFHSSYSMPHSSFPYWPESLRIPTDHAASSINPERYPELDSYLSVRPRSDPRDYYPSGRHREFYPRGHSFYDATRSLLLMNSSENMSLLENGAMCGNSASQSTSDSEILNLSFPPHVSTTTPFWQQYSNLAKVVLGQDAAGSDNASLDIAKRRSGGSTTDTASNSSQDRTMNSPASVKINSPSSVRSPPMLTPDKQLAPNTPQSSSVYLKNSDSNYKTKRNISKENAANLTNVAIRDVDKIQPLRPSKFNTKHFITQSAMESFPHLSKGSSLQNHSVNSLFNSQQSILEKASSKSSLAGVKPVTSMAVRIASNPVTTLSVSSKQELHQQHPKTTANSFSTQPLATTDEEALKQLGRQLSLQSSPSQSKILLSELTLPIKTTMFSSPIMTYHQIKPSTTHASSTTFEAKKQLPPTQRPGSVASYSVSSNSIMTGVIRLSSPTDVLKHNVPAESWCPKSPSQSTVRLPMEFKVANLSNSKIAPNMTIYKPGSASVTKSGKRGRSTNKVAKRIASDSKQIEKVNNGRDPENVTNYVASTTYSTIIPSPGGRLIYQNPVMTILPSHSRLLVVSNATSALTSSSSYQTVLYINSQNSTQKTRYPIAVGSSSKLNVTGSFPTVTNSLAAGAVVTSSIVTNPSIMEAVVTMSNSSNVDTRIGIDSTKANPKIPDPAASSVN